MSFVLAGVAVAIPIMIALFIRKQLASRPTLGAVIVVIAAGAGIVAAFVLLQYRNSHLETARIDDALAHLDDAMCKAPVPVDPDAAALQQIGCTPAARAALLEIDGISITVVALRDKAAVIVTAFPDTNTSTTYSLRLVDAAGRTVVQSGFSRGTRILRDEKLAAADQVELLVQHGPTVPESVVARAKLAVP